MSSSTVFALPLTCVFLLIVQTSHGSEIIGGKEAKPHSLPYIALLRDKARMCGGILIDPKWVLTAAHCGNFKEVELGVHSIRKKEGCHQKISVQQNIPHPSYDNRKKVNDLMLLKLKRKAKITKEVKHILLGNSIQDPKPGTSCLVAGWGKTKYKVNKTSDVLMEVNVTVIDRVKCNSPDYYNSNPVITKDMICAGSDGKKETDTCGGDSGGPLVCKGALVGVTSFGIECGLIKKPGVYAFLSGKQLKWIKETMKKSEMQ